MLFVGMKLPKKLDAARFASSAIGIFLAGAGGLGALVSGACEKQIQESNRMWANELAAAVHNPAAKIVSAVITNGGTSFWIALPGA